MHAAFKRLKYTRARPRKLEKTFCHSVNLGIGGCKNLLNSLWPQILITLRWTSVHICTNRYDGRSGKVLQKILTDSEITYSIFIRNYFSNSNSELIKLFCFYLPKSIRKFYILRIQYRLSHPSLIREKSRKMSALIKKCSAANEVAEWGAELHWWLRDGGISGCSDQISARVLSSSPPTLFTKTKKKQEKSRIFAIRNNFICSISQFCRCSIIFP